MSITGGFIVLKAIKRTLQQLKAHWKSQVFNWCLKARRKSDQNIRSWAKSGDVQIWPFPNLKVPQANPQGHETHFADMEFISSLICGCERGGGPGSSWSLTICAGNPMWAPWSSPSLLRHASIIIPPIVSVAAELEAKKKKCFPQYFRGNQSRAAGQPVKRHKGIYSIGLCCSGLLFLIFQLSKHPNLAGLLLLLFLKNRGVGGGGEEWKWYCTITHSIPW